MPAVSPGTVGQEAQVVDLLADLGDEGKQDAGGGAEEEKVEAGAALLASGEFRPLGQQFRLLGEHEPEGRDEEHRPEGLRPELQSITGALS